MHRTSSRVSFRHIYAQNMAQPQHRVLYLLLAFQRAAIYAELRLLVIGGTLLHGLIDVQEQFIVRLVFQQRPFLFAQFQAPGQNMRLHFYIHGLPFSVHIFHIIKKAGGSASQRDNDILKLRHFMQHIALYLAKTLLSPLIKNLADGSMKPSLNIPIKVDEIHVQCTGKGLSQRGLPGTHKTQKEYFYHHVDKITE